MNRRTYLERSAAVGLASVLAGCTDQSLGEAKDQPPWVDARFSPEEVDLPVTQQSDVVESGIERAEGETFAEPGELESYLAEEGVAVETLEEREEAGETILELEYAAEAPIEEGAARGVGLVAGGYATLVRGGYDGDELSASLLEPDGSTFGEFEIRTEWARAYDEGEISTADYGGEALRTLEST